MRVNAATGRRGVKGLRDEGVKEETRRFWILNFGLADEIGSRKGRKGRKGGILFGNAKCAPRLRDALTREIWNLRKGNFEKRSCIEALADLA